MECDHLTLSQLDRRLILSAVANSPRVYLAPMDKGLSGSTVWQARWQLPDANLSKLHVFKIGPVKKLDVEERAMIDIASVIDRNFPMSRLYRIDGEERALLRQEFAGDANGTTSSLRNFIRLPSSNSTPDQVADVINRLFSNRMKAWHYNGRVDHTVEQSIDRAVPWWRSKIDLLRVAHSIGFQSINDELLEVHGLSVDDLCTKVEAALTSKRTQSTGPVHGDLHVSNVNLDEHLEVYLIDFGNTTYTWRALDFIILEAAIKFVAAPAHAPLKSLLECEELIDRSAHPSNLRNGAYYGTELQKILAAVIAIRGHCVRSGAEINIDNYRAGLICACAAFTSIEWWVNRRFLFHSIAYHLNRLGSHA